jgi:Gpi18-like mannosyltransferase
MKKPDFFYIFFLFLSSRLLVYLITFLALNLLPFYLTDHQTLLYNSDYGNYWERWSNWDGGHFRGIAESGYQSFQTVFFPLYPLLIRALMLIKINSLVSGLLVSYVSAIFATIYLFKLAQLEFKEQKANEIMFLFLIFPTSFFLTAVYSESPFLALTLASFYYAKQKKWWLAFLLGGLSFSTRLVGIATLIGIFVDYFLTNKHFKREQAINLIPNLIISLLPFSFYILFLIYKFQTPLTFLTSEQLWQRSLTFPSFTLGNFLFLTQAATSSNLILGQLIIHYIFLIILIAGLIISFKKLPKKYFVFYLISLILPLSSGTLNELPRYSLTIFPLLFILAGIRNETVKKGWLIFSLSFLILLSILFINGYPLI